MVDTKVSTIIFVSKKKTARAVKDRTGSLGIVFLWPPPNSTKPGFCRVKWGLHLFSPAVDSR